MSVRAAMSAFTHRGVRRRHAIELVAYSGGLVALLLLVASWICAQARLAPRMYTKEYNLPEIPWNELALADIFGVMLLALGLFVLAPAAIAATVAAERRSGTLDQLRTTPLDPFGLLVGLVVGAPARFYILCAGPLALHVLCGLTGIIPLDTLATSLITLGLGGAVCAMVAMAVALAPRQDSGGAFIALGVAGLLGVSGLIAAALATERQGVSWSFLHPAGALNASMLVHDGLWRHLAVGYWSLEKFNEPAFSSALAFSPLLSAVVSLAGGVLLARASCRKLASPHLPLFSKAQAVAMFALFAAAIILPLPSFDPSGRRAGMTALGFGMFLLPVMGTLGLFATPSFEAWALALRRGKKPNAWSDDGAPHQAVWVMLVIFVLLVNLRLGGMGFPWQVRDRHLVAFAWSAWVAFSLPIFMLFAATRYQTAATRWAFGVAVGAHLLFQVICIGLSTDGYLAFSERTVVQIGLLASFFVPSWVLFRQQTLRKHTLAASA